MAKCYFYNEDCLASMKRMQEKGFKVDLVLSSPPYNTGRPSNSKRSIENLESRYDIHLDDMTDEEYAKWITDIFNNFDKILNENVNNNMPPKEKIRVIHDYIIDHTEYDKLKYENKNDDTYKSNTAYGVLIEGYGTCNGYADAMEIFLDKMNIINYMPIL